MIAYVALLPVVIFTLFVAAEIMRRRAAHPEPPCPHDTPARVRIVEAPYDWEDEQ